MFKVDHTPHLDRDIAQRYPTGRECVSPCTQIDQVIVSAGTLVRTWMGEANNFALMQVGLPLKKLLIEVPETRHGAKILVLLRTNDLKKCFRAGKDSIEERATEVQNDISIKKTL